MIPTVVGYAGFKSYGDKPYSSFKPGQAKERDYFSHATHEKPDGKAVLENFTRYGTVYTQKVASTVQPGIYQVPVKNANTMISYEYGHKPELLQHMKIARVGSAKPYDTVSQSSASSLSSASTTKPLPTSHWKSTYQGVVQETLSKPASQSKRPEWSLPRQAYTSQRTFFVTEGQRSYGVYGSKPTDRINQETGQIENPVHELTVGTTKTTSHIPGYNGFLPKTDINAVALQQSMGQNARETIIKQNIVENFHVRIPGYSGHKPMSAMNDRGTIRPSCLSGSGESYN
ncbi:hypothetical protein FGO68_gene16976 [Halteria grandinella]|uniref:Uncharacterized protein n=1 Tax=Halteria grandinella TaxID=5974 RepID=A0A8J8SVW9_HALGN|nr:hypothetical protein FGO68_gene16976 [Halteria grandinella]